MAEEHGVAAHDDDVAVLVGLGLVDDVVHPVYCHVGTEYGIDASVFLVQGHRVGHHGAFGGDGVHIGQAPVAPVQHVGVNPVAVGLQIAEVVFWTSYLVLFEGSGDGVAGDGGCIVLSVLWEVVFAVEQCHGGNVLVLGYEACHELCVLAVVLGKGLRILCRRLYRRLHVGYALVNDLDGTLHGTVALEIGLVGKDVPDVLRLPDARNEQDGNDNHQHQERGLCCYGGFEYVQELHIRILLFVDVQTCVCFAHQQLVAVVEQFHIDATLENHDDVRASELEEAHLVATMQRLTYVQRGNPVDAAYLRHTDGKHGYQAVVFSLDDGASTCLDHLESEVVDVVVELLLVVPEGIASACRHSGYRAQLLEHTIYGGMVAVVAVDVQEGMCQRASGKGILVL